MYNTKVLVIDYGMGNLFSIERAVSCVGGSVEISDSSHKISSADRLILPGVGAFGRAIYELEKKGLIDAIYDFVRRGRPLLGICLGMQLLMSESEEFNACRGLDLISGKVERLLELTRDGVRLKIPHIGWNTLTIPRLRESEDFNNGNGNKILRGVTLDSYFYFVHSFACLPDDPSCVLRESIYGVNRFCSALCKDNIYACQFHPERSGRDGLQVYKNFIFRI